MSEAIVVSGLGLCTSLGPNPVQPMAKGATAVRPHSELSGLPSDLSATIDRVDLRPWLKRRKDKKLMARPAQLALAAAGRALGDWPGDRAELGLFLGVGREPGDEGESEAALLAAQIDGRLDERSVAGACRDLYPPLLPLRTLPNMALAHISIHLGICGTNGVWAGHAGAGLVALRSAIWAVREGRCPAALVGAADSRIDAAHVRDSLRQPPGGSSPAPPGEAGVMLLIEPEHRAKRFLARLALTGCESRGPRAHHDQLGDCGSADALLAVALAILRRESRHTTVAADPGQPELSVTVAVDAACAWYACAD
jgi:hypothetical protein